MCKSSTYVYNMLPRSSHCLNIPTQDAVIDNKYMKLFDARSHAIRTLGRGIKQYLTACNIEFLDILETTSYFMLPPWCIRPPKIILDLMHVKKDRTCASSSAFCANTRQAPRLHSCLYRWFTVWKLFCLCFSLSNRYRNFHHIYC